MKAKLYLETTIPSYLVGWPSRDLMVAAHQQITREWWELRREEFELYVSELVLRKRARVTPSSPAAAWISWRAFRFCRSLARYWSQPKI